MSEKLHGDMVAVARAAAKAGKFSVFEMTGRLASTMTALIHGPEARAALEG